MDDLYKAPNSVVGRKPLSRIDPDYILFEKVCERLGVVHKGLNYIEDGNNFRFEDDGSISVARELFEGLKKEEKEIGLAYLLILKDQVSYASMFLKAVAAEGVATMGLLCFPSFRRIETAGVGVLSIVATMVVGAAITYFFQHKPRINKICDATKLFGDSGLSFLKKIGYKTEHNAILAKIASDRVR